MATTRKPSAPAKTKSSAKDEEKKKAAAAPAKAAAKKPAAPKAAAPKATSKATAKPAAKAPAKAVAKPSAKADKPAKAAAKPEAKKPAKPKAPAKDAKKSPAPAAKKPAPAKKEKAAKPAAKPTPKAPAKDAKKTPAAKTKEAPAAAAKKPAPAKKAPAPVPAAAQAPVAKPAPVEAVAPKKGFTVQLGATRPTLSIAPGAMISGRNMLRRRAPDAPAAVERKLGKKELGAVRADLEERRERLLAGMKRELAVQRERSGAATADEVDKATDAYDEELSFEIASANDEELKEIAVALEKIARGTYGECEICGQGISPSRLRILPFATTCVSCRGQEEQARRRDDAGSPFSLLGDDDAEATETDN